MCVCLAPWLCAVPGGLLLIFLITNFICKFSLTNMNHHISKMYIFLLIFSSVHATVSVSCSSAPSHERPAADHVSGCQSWVTVAGQHRVSGQCRGWRRQHDARERTQRSAHEGVGLFHQRHWLRCSNAALCWTQQGQVTDKNQRFNFWIKNEEMIWWK